MKMLMAVIIVAGLSGCAVNPNVTVSDRPVNDEDIAHCLHVAKYASRVVWKDRESVRIEEAKWGKVGSYDALLVMVNAKNSFGGYAGATPGACIWDDGMIIRFQYLYW